MNRKEIITRASSLVSPSFLSKKEKGTFYAIGKDDVSDLCTSSFMIDFLVEMNKKIYSSKIVVKKPATIILSSKDGKKFLSSSDMYIPSRYTVERVNSLDPVSPRFSKTKLTCPSCKKPFVNYEPSYILPPCPTGCDLHPNNWMVREKKFIDVASGQLVLKSKERGKQLVTYYIDRHMIGANNNYTNIASAMGGMGTISLDAIPFPEYQGKQDFSFALWVFNSRLHIKKLEANEIVDALEFKVSKPPTNEMEVVSLFSENIVFMKAMLGFNHRFEQSNGFPDMIILQQDGTKKIIEFEFESRNFEKHNHDPRITDYIICWNHNRKIDDDIKVISLKSLDGQKMGMVS